MYRAVKELKEKDERMKTSAQSTQSVFSNKKETIDADFKIID
jgi:hypothetical protein